MYDSLNNTPTEMAQTPQDKEDDAALYEGLNKSPSPMLSKRKGPFNHSIPINSTR